VFNDDLMALINKFIVMFIVKRYINVKVVFFFKFIRCFEVLCIAVVHTIFLTCIETHFGAIVFIALSELNSMFLGTVSKANLGNEAFYRSTTNPFKTMLISQ